MKKKKKFNQRAVLLKYLKILFKYAETFTQNGIQEMILNKNKKNRKMLIFIYGNRPNLWSHIQWFLLSWHTANPLYE
jgi:hypothetical protein